MKKRKLKQLLKQLQAALVSQAPDPGRPLNEWLDVHERQLAQRGLNEQTMRNRAVIVAHVRRLWGVRPMRTLRPHEISADLRRDFLPTRSSTARRVLAELRDAYHEAIANDWADSNPAQHVKMPTHRVKRDRLTLDVWQQMRTLSQASPQRWVQSLLLLALATGQRRADLAKMRFDDVRDGCLYVEQQKKAGKPIGARVAIPLAIRLAATGMTLGDVIEHCRHSAAPGPTLLRTAGGGSIERSSLSARFHEHIVAVLGDGAYAMHEWPSLHEARSLSARTYVAEGMTPAQVQTLLGHKHVEMTSLYLNDRGLSDGEWKRVEVPAAA